MSDLAGHLFYVFLIVGTTMTGRGMRSGWLLRLVGSLGWAAIGLYIGMTSILLWSLAFAVIDYYNYSKWKNEQTP